jgi:hypothetical protein
MAETDEYGGALSNPSPSGATGFFRVEKDVNQRWWFVTPAGNRFWMRACQIASSGGITPANWAKLGAGKYHADNAPPEYHTEVSQQRNYAKHQNRRLLNWGFNYLGWASGSYNKPVGTTSWVHPGNPVKIPFSRGGLVGSYAMQNKFAASYDATMDIIAGCNPVVFNTGVLPDVYAPQFAEYYRIVAGEAYDVHPATPERTAAYRGTGGFAYGGWPHPGLVDEPWLIGCMYDENDSFMGLGPGPEFAAKTVRGTVHPHISWLCLITKPTQTINPHSSWNYRDTKCYSKHALKDFLIARYTTIENLNAAWGSFYTQWETDGLLGGFVDEDGTSPYLSGVDDKDLSGVSPAFQADLNSFLENWADTLYGAIESAYRAACPNHLLFSTNHLNAWQGMTRREILRGMAPHIDVLIINYNHWSEPLNEIVRETYDEVGKPIICWKTMLGQADSAMSAYPRDESTGNYVTQELRGLAYERAVKLMFDAQGSNGDHPIIGCDWWMWVDKYSGENANFGLVTPSDNAYDGREAVMAAGADPWGYQTGGEAADYGDFISSVVRLNGWIETETQGKGEQIMTLDWDYADNAGITGFRIYMSGTPGVIPDGATFFAEIPYPTKHWVVSPPAGQVYAAVTAYVDDGAGNITESGPSNELAFVVPEDPTNFRIRRPLEEA